MRAVYKYELEITGEQVLRIPKGAQLNYFGEQNGKLFVWADVRDTNDLEDRVINIFGTGHPIGDHPYEWMGTVQMSNGLVWHIYEGCSGDTE